MEDQMKLDETGPVAEWYSAFPEQLLWIQGRSILQPTTARDDDPPSPRSFPISQKKEQLQFQVYGYACNPYLLKLQGYDEVVEDVLAEEGQVEEVFAIHQSSNSADTKEAELNVSEWIEKVEQEAMKEEEVLRKEAEWCLEEEDSVQTGLSMKKKEVVNPLEGLIHIQPIRLQHRPPSHRMQRRR